MEFFLILALFTLAVTYVLPIASWVSARRTRRRVSDLQAALAEQQLALERISKRLVELDMRERAAAAVTEAPSAAPGVPPAPVVKPPVVTPPVLPAPSVAQPPVATPPAATPPPAAAPPAPIVQRPWPDLPPPKPVEPPPPRPPIVQRPWPELEHPPSAGAQRDRAAAPIAKPRPESAAPPPSPPRPPRPPVPPETPPPARSFDWEGLVGVKMFSAIAGIALVFAAVLFLRYSVQQGWLQPPVRVLIGVLVGIALLVLCELKAARKYPATANALDAAAIAILFSTFFAAHALWNLIPAPVTFGLLAVVTAVAVLLSIRRESLFIAVLGLLGGFATPALLSTGENRPIPLFAYLLLLNVGLAWVAYRQTWPVLTVLTLVLTTIYQWGWVFKFLSQSDLPLAMGIFLIFPIVSLAGLLLARRPSIDHRDAGEGATFERTAMVAAALPVFFAAYLATVPAYGARAGLLFGFLSLIDAGLFAIAIARGRATLHAIGALATVVVTAVWFATSYRPDFANTVLSFAGGFVAFYLAAPRVASWFSRPLTGAAGRAVYAAPFLLFVFPVLAAIEPAFVAPWPLFLPLLGLLLLCAWRAIASTEAFVYFIAAFFAVAAQAVWSTEHLTVARLGTAVALYAIFGLVTAMVPVLARRIDRTLQPEWTPGLMLLASMGLLLYLASGNIAPAALWALALLLAILNAGIFIESASARLPIVALAGTVLSYVILAIWWTRAAATVGVMPSLAVLTGLSLVTLGGYAWAHRHTRQRAAVLEASGFADGLYLALTGHLFLFFVAINREWSLPPWPLFGTLAVLTLATSATSLVTRRTAVHVAGVTAAALIAIAWTASAVAEPWPAVGVGASAVVSLFALAWIAIARRFDSVSSAAAAAAAALFIAELGLVVVTAGAHPPAFPIILAAHVINLSLLLALTWTQRWDHVAIVVALTGWLGLAAWQIARPLATEWKELLILAGAMYVVFTAYPLIVGSRARDQREPWLAALVAAAMTFFSARAAFTAGQLEWMIGAVPVAQGLVTAVLLRALLRLEPPGKRDLGRLALVAGAALSFVTVAIPLQLEHQWITIGWALEGAALAWLYGRIPHRGLLLASVALLGTAFVRLAMNPAIFTYEPRGAARIFNWYLYTYVVVAAALFVAAWCLSRTNDRLEPLPRMSHLLPAGAVILLFIVLNIEIADYYATGPEIMFRFGVTLSQDLTYTIGWLVFGMALLAAGIYAAARPARVAAVILIAFTTFKCFLYDLSSLEGLYRIGSFVGLAMSLALVSLALQKYVLAKPKEAS